MLVNPLYAFQLSYIANCIHLGSQHEVKGGHGVQLLEKSNRLETFADEGVARQLRSVTCGNCGQAGHYHQTCQGHVPTVALAHTVLISVCGIVMTFYDMYIVCIW